MLAQSFMNNVEAYLYEEDNSSVDQLLPLYIVWEYVCMRSAHLPALVRMALINPSLLSTFLTHQSALEPHLLFSMPDSCHVLDFFVFTSLVVW